jgi:AcrR family transcriptional regulator
LTAAAQLLDERGFAAMTMEGLLDAGGIAKRTLYRWWPSKSAVVAEAIIAGFVAVPNITVPAGADVWNDLGIWLVEVAESVRGPYGEVLRAASEIGAGDASLGQSLNQTFAVPARANLRERLLIGVHAGQISPDADLDATIDLFMAVITFVGLTREDVGRIPAVLRVIRSGIEPSPQ